MQRAILLIAFSCAISTNASAQWLKYPTAGVPRTPGGKPDLTAPVPRTPDGKPDLSGIWDIEHNRPCPPPGCFDMEVGQEFVNIGWSLKGGLPYQPWAAAARKTRNDENGKDDPVTHCLPGGVVKSHTSPFLRKIVQTPTLIVFLREAESSYRQVFTMAGRCQPSSSPRMTATRSDDGMVTLWLSRPSDSKTERGSIAAEAR